MTRKAILAKIKALLQMTVANGCTEAEAMTALSKARDMMASHEVDATDLAFDGEEITIDGRTVADRDRARVNLLASVGRFCQCRAWRGRLSDQLYFAGFESDVIFAHWLLDMLADFVGRACKQFLADTWTPQSPSVRRTETNGFILGCCGRISDRLDALAMPAGVSANALVVSKNGLIERAMAAKGVRLRDTFHLGRPQPRDAFTAGEEAGDGATFNKPVDRRETMRIGKL